MRPPLLHAMYIKIAVATLAIAIGDPALSQQTAPVGECRLEEQHSYLFDYRRSNWINKDRYDWQLKDVEDNHFRPQTELLVRSTRGLKIGNDFDYVLTRWPNHHRVMVALVRLGERERTDKPAGTKYTIGCYFERGLKFAPEDTVLRGLYASYLARQSLRDHALYHLNQMIQQAEQNVLAPLTFQNAGLIYLELGEHALALQQAYRAEEFGLPATNPLRVQLEALGKWRPRDSGESVSPPPSALSASAASSAPE